MWSPFETKACLTKLDIEKTRGSFTLNERDNFLEAKKFLKKGVNSKILGHKSFSTIQEFFYQIEF